MGAARGLRAGTLRNGARSNPPKGSAPSRHPSRSGTLGARTGRPTGTDGARGFGWGGGVQVDSAAAEAEVAWLGRLVEFI